MKLFISALFTFMLILFGSGTLPLSEPACNTLHQELSPSHDSSGYAQSSNDEHTNNCTDCDNNCQSCGQSFFKLALQHHQLGQIQTIKTIKHRFFEIFISKYSPLSIYRPPIS